MLARGALQAEVEPLAEFGVRIGTQPDLEVVRRGRVDHLDRACVEGAGNARAHRREGIAVEGGFNCGRR